MQDGRRARKPPSLLDAAGLWDFALKSLAARGLSAGELREKLRRKAEGELERAGIWQPDWAGAKREWFSTTVDLLRPRIGQSCGSNQIAQFRTLTQALCHHSQNAIGRRLLQQIHQGIEPAER